MTVTKTTAIQTTGILKEAFRWFVGYPGKSGILALFLTVFLLSALVGVNVSPRPARTTIGEIAENDILSPVNLVIKDDHATQVKRDQVASSLPAIFDLSPSGALAFRDRVRKVFTALNRVDTPEEKRALAERLSEELQIEVTPELLQIWSNPEFQKIVSSKIMPLIESSLREGVVADARVLFEYKGGIIMRDINSKSETFRSDYRSITDLKLLEVELSQVLKSDPEIPLAVRRNVPHLVQPLIPPTLAFNREATATRAEEVLGSVTPVEYNLQKGEVIIRKGDRITREDQLKVNALREKLGKRFFAIPALGALLMGLILSAGLFFAPSGHKGNPMRTKDLYFISFLLLLFALGAKVLAIHANTLDPNALFNHQGLAYAFPVSGAAGLSALVFSARRYVITGLLLAFFCTLLVEAGLGVFMFYFLGAMWTTWLVRRTQSRHDMMMAVFPLTAGLLLTWAAAAGCTAASWDELLAGLPSAAINGVLSIFIMFAFSPALEVAFRFTTRFRLMELMNLEQPLLQELMVKTPGTYHHSLLVSNLVEAGAKAVNCNSMLCKVAALYHDIGKLVKPEYFIENLFGRENKHDKLSPSMSSLILQSHVKRGVELATQHRLGTEITDIIRQHHGTNIIQFFYQKAKDLGENPRPEDYRYAGPRPQTREAAIVMLADAVEASSRTLSDPTPSRIQNHVNQIVKNIFAQGQLDESQLTFQDINKLCDSFQRVLTGIFHHRIEYPDQKKERSGPAEAQGNGQPVEGSAANAAQTGGAGGANGNGTASAVLKAPASENADKNGKTC